METTRGRVIPSDAFWTGARHDGWAWSRDGIQGKVVAAEWDVHEHTVGEWRRRFQHERIEGLPDKARPGRPWMIDDDRVAAVIERVLCSTPADATHWSIRPMAGVTGSRLDVAVRRTR